MNWKVILCFSMMLFLFPAGCVHAPVKVASAEGAVVMDESFSVQMEADVRQTDSEDGGYPVFRVHLEYTGQESCQIVWDSNFGAVLWQGDFVLVSSAGEARESTGELKFRTSNTYAPQETVSLVQGDRLEAVLDFGQLPASYAVNLFELKGEVQFQLFRRIVLDDFREKLVPVSRALMIRVK